MYLQKEATHTEVCYLNLLLNQEDERADQRDSDASNETRDSAGESAHYSHFQYHKHMKELGYQSCV